MFLVYLAALFILWLSSFFFVFKLLISLLLAGFFVLRIVYSSSPYPVPVQLVAAQEKWVLTLKNQQPEIYDHYKIMLDAGLFFLLRLSSAQQTRVLTVFFDQISAEDYRVIKAMIE